MSQKIVNQKTQVQQNTTKGIEKYQKYEIYADWANRNTAWEVEFGDVTAPLALKSLDGKFVTQPNLKMWVHNLEFQKFLKTSFNMIPHGKVDQIVKQIAESELKKEKLSLLKKETGHRGHTQYWKYMGDEEFNISGNDKVKIGFVVRNGIGTGVALGVDVFTYRLICSNGAVARGKNLKSFSIRHVGTDANKMVRSFTDQIKETMESAKQIIQYYRKATQIKVNDELANIMYQKLARLGETYLPEHWNIKTTTELKKLKKDGKFKGNLSLVKVKKEISLWDTFNIITQNERDRLNQKKINFPLLVKHQDKLHQTVFEIVNRRGGL